MTITTEIKVDFDNLKEVMSLYGLSFKRREESTDLMLMAKGKSQVLAEVLRCDGVCRGFWGCYEARFPVISSSQWVRAGVHNQKEAKLKAVENAIKTYNLQPIGGK